MTMSAQREEAPSKRQACWRFNLLRLGSPLIGAPPRSAYARVRSNPSNMTKFKVSIMGMLLAAAVATLIVAQSCLSHLQHHRTCGPAYGGSWQSLRNGAAHFAYSTVPLLSSPLASSCESVHWRTEKNPGIALEMLGKVTSGALVTSSQNYRKWRERRGSNP